MNFKDLMSIDLTSKILRWPGQAKDEHHSQLILASGHGCKNLLHKPSKECLYLLLEDRLYLYIAAQNHKPNPGEKFSKLH